MNKISAISIVLCLLCISQTSWARIDRQAVVNRNNPHITSIDTLASLSVGNGEFAFTADVTGLQTFAEQYSKGIPLGTQAQWGWHTNPNLSGVKPEDALNETGYSCQAMPGTPQGRAADWLRANPHRLHLGNISFLNMEPSDISDIDQTLDLWTGSIASSFKYFDDDVNVTTSCDPEKDMVTFNIHTTAYIPVMICFPYPTAQHTDDGCEWNFGNHTTELIETADNVAIFKRTLDDDVYYVKVSWKNAEEPFIPTRNRVRINPSADDWSFSVLFSADKPSLTYEDNGLSRKAAKKYWKDYWTKGGFVDFGQCTAPEAKELERRVILSQYLLAIQCAGSTPPQETGLTYNSWFGKYHLEMTWWHEANFALWGHDDLLLRTLPWYKSAAGMAREIAERQGYEGIRWMKMTDPSGAEAPSNIGSYLIWQQPHLIYMAELLYRSKPSKAFIEEYYSLIQESAKFMASFLKYDSSADRYYISGAIPAQETLRPETTINPPFELSYWHFGLSVAQMWRERMGEPRVAEWDVIIEKLSHLAAKDGLYLAAESAADTYTNIRMTSDHMAVLAVYGVLPECPLFDKETMRSTLNWVLENWNWDQTWGWDYPTTAMNAVRLGEPEKAIEAILMDKRTNTYLPNGHNYQDNTLRCYLPGNGGLLTTIALMCAGWDGCTEENPGFPKDGRWNVKWENIKPLP